MSDRRKAREIAVQSLYEISHTEETYSRALGANVERRSADAPVRQHAERLLREVDAHRDEIQSRIEAALAHWSFERVALVDRCILMVGCAEILYFEDIPHGVAINEAVEIARKFSTDESRSFVNGVLDRIARDESGSSLAEAEP